MKSLIDDIRLSIYEDGYAYVTGLERSKFDMISDTMGTILYTTDIKLDNSKSNVVYNPEEILFHTDYPKAQIVCWYCIDSNGNEAPIELLDTNNFIGWSKEGIEALESIHVLFKCKLTSAVYSIPLILQDKFKIETTYNPWGIQSDTSETRLNDFYNYLEKCRQISISMNKGDALFIDNHRLLHGRKSISSNSKRHLIRHFVKTKDLDQLTLVGDLP